MKIHPDAQPDPPISEDHLVLSVDDDSSILKSLRRSLRREPYELITARSVREGLNVVWSRPISLILADLRMPEMDGLEMLQTVRSWSPVTTGALLTAYPESIRVQPGIGRTPRMLLSKPWNDALLRRTIRELLLEREQRFRDRADADNPTDYDIGGSG